MDGTVGIHVEVKRHGDKAVLVVNAEGQDAWVPYSVIDDNSEIFERTPAGTGGTLVIPEWKAAELGWT